MVTAAKKPKEIPKTAKEKALDAFMAKMAKNYGDGVFEMTDEVVPYTITSTGSITLDYYLGVGGWVVGRIHEIWGPEGAGKTTLAMESCAAAQINFPDQLIGWIDVEHRHDKLWGMQHGLNYKRTTLVRPNNAEEVADQLKDMCRSGLYSMIVVDSVGAMITSGAIDKDAEKSDMGKIAQVITRMVQINAVEADKHHVTILLINQVRANFGYGSDTTTGGGFALKHGTTTKLFLKRSSGEGKTFQLQIDGEKRTIGHEISVKIERNSVAPAYRTATFVMFYIPTEKFGPVGIDTADEAFNVGKLSRVIQRDGAWYTFTTTGERFQGGEKVVEYLRQHPEECEAIRVAALALLAIPTILTEDPWEAPVEEEIVNASLTPLEPS